MRDADIDTLSADGAQDTLRLAIEQLMESEMEDAKALMRQHHFVIDVDLSKPIPELTELERWQKLAFTLYTMLTPHGTRIQTWVERLRND